MVTWFNFDYLLNVFRSSNVLIMSNLSFVILHSDFLIFSVTL